jgi:hypothetical protein
MIQTVEAEMALCWEARRGRVAEEIEEMWAAVEGRYALRDYLRSTYREGLPDDWRRYLRNDGVADWYEVCVLRD